MSTVPVFMSTPKTLRITTAPSSARPGQRSPDETQSSPMQNADTVSSIMSCGSTPVISFIRSKAGFPPISRILLPSARVRSFDVARFERDTAIKYLRSG